MVFLSKGDFGRQLSVSQSLSLFFISLSLSSPQHPYHLSPSLLSHVLSQASIPLSLFLFLFLPYSCLFKSYITCNSLFLFSYLFLYLSVSLFIISNYIISIHLFIFLSTYLPNSLPPTFPLHHLLTPLPRKLDHMPLL